jgi:hypothetical protein
VVWRVAYGGPQVELLEIKETDGSTVRSAFYDNVVCK